MILNKFKFCHICWLSGLVQWLPSLAATLEVLGSIYAWEEIFTTIFISFFVGYFTLEEVNLDDKRFKSLTSLLSKHILQKKLYQYYTDKCQGRLAQRESVCLLIQQSGFDSDCCSRWIFLSHRGRKIHVTSIYLNVLSSRKKKRRHHLLEIKESWLYTLLLSKRET